MVKLQHLIWTSLCLAPFAAAGQVSCDAPGTLSYAGRPDGSAVAFFYPNGSLSAIAEACLGPGAHFNWYQIGIADPQPPRNATVPYVDPQPGGNAFVVGGWRDSLPWYYDELPPGSGPGCIQNGVDTCQFYSPISWQITSPCITYLAGKTCPMFNYTPARDILAYSDTPQNPQGSIQLSFETRLVIVSADQASWAFVAGFAWDWANPSPLLGVSSNFRPLTDAQLQNPPPARQGGGPPPPFLDDPPPHSSLGFPPNPVFHEATMIPEPSSFALLGLGAAVLLVGYRRRGPAFRGRRSGNSA